MSRLASRPLVSRNHLSPIMILTIAMALSLTSCRFGNRVEQQDNPDQITGYYSNELSTVAYCATLSGSNPATQTCKSVPTSQVPQDFTLVMSNPVILLMSDIATGEARLFSKDNNGYYLRTVVSDGNKLGYSSTGKPVTFWKDVNCSNVVTDTQLGSFTKTTDQKSAEGLKLSGSLEITFTHSATVEGDCAATLQLIHDCYLDMAQCAGTSMTENALIQETFQNFLNPYIQAGAFTVADITRLTALGYEVAYQ